VRWVLVEFSTFVLPRRFRCTLRSQEAWGCLLRIEKAELFQVRSTHLKAPSNTGCHGVRSCSVDDQSRMQGRNDCLAASTNLLVSTLVPHRLNSFILSCLVSVAWFVRAGDQPGWILYLPTTRIETEEAATTTAASNRPPGRRRRSTGGTAAGSGTELTPESPWTF
jgi:hypothetical protein